MFGSSVRVNGVNGIDHEVVVAQPTLNILQL